MADIEAYIQEETEAWFDELVDSLRQTGRRLVDKARAKTKSDGGFGNITWNLRASIGMCLVDETGRIVETYFPPINKGDHGNKIGRDMAEAIAVYGREAQEMTMVFVAAEEYAVFVQAKGKDVIKHVIGDNLEPALLTVLGS
ncbi:MAG: hypothetical protein EOO88_29465 [Pedobacter sp.]|nr:MAG: hypothetical protein EOO88_29465 [Pedobacter sp.]